MKRLSPIIHLKWSLLAGLVVGLAAMAITVGLATAAPLPQETEPAEGGEAVAAADPGRCGACHLDVTNAWSDSTHAHAFNDPVFQERWHALGEAGDCLLCHTTNYQATGNTYDAAGVACEACHGNVSDNHPEEPAEIRDDAAYCGTCHTTTMAEWRLTGHAAAEVGCTDCHDPHSQKALFKNPDEMCINCHQDSMGPYLEDIHIQKDIGCVDCHALVIPPEEPPADGIVPTGHSFTITPATCVACHTDSLHSGFSLPGWESGAKAAGTETDSEVASSEVENAPHPVFNSPQEQVQLLETQLQTLQASSASRSMTVLFQGAVVGLVLGGSTAWIVASNVRRGRTEEEAEHGEEK